MSDTDDACLAAARAIVSHTDSADLSEDDHLVRSHIEAFYSLTHLTPSDTLDTAAEVEIARALEVPHEFFSQESRSAARREAEARANDEPAGSVVSAGTAPGAPKKPLRGAARIAAVLSKTTRVPVIAGVIVLVALVLSVAGNVINARPPRFAPRYAVYLVGMSASPDTSGVLLANGSSGLVFLSGLADLTTGNRYIAWGIYDDEYRRLGRVALLGSGRGSLSYEGMAFPDGVEITIEGDARPAEPQGPSVAAGLAPVDHLDL